MKDSRGAGLTELVVVIACVGIVLSATVPNLHRLSQEWNLWGAAHLLHSTLQWGRMHAVSANTSLALVIEPGGGRFYWADPASGLAFGSSVRDLPGGVRFAASPARPLRFFPRGNAAPAGTFVLRGEAGQYRVIVNPAGRVRVQKD